MVEALRVQRGEVGDAAHAAFGVGHDGRVPLAIDHAAVARTIEIASRCTFSLAQIRYRYPSEKLPSGKTTSQWLRELTQEAA